MFIHIYTNLLISSRVIEWNLRLAQTGGSGRDRSDGLVAYYYCSKKRGQSGGLGDDPAVLLRCLIRQLAWTLDGEIASPVLRAYQKWSVERPDTCGFLMEESADLLVELILALPDTTIIIDALDECAQPYGLLRWLQKISNSAVGHLRILVSGRDNIDVASVFTHCQRTSIGSRASSRDLQIFIRNEVKHGERKLLKGTKPDLEDRLIDTLSRRAQGK